jgi:hypothetical protein
MPHRRSKNYKPKTIRKTMSKNDSKSHAVGERYNAGE